MSKKMENAVSRQLVDRRFEELNDFLGDCAADLESIIDALGDLKNTFELYDFLENSADTRFTDNGELPF